MSNGTDDRRTGGREIHPIKGEIDCVDLVTSRQLEGNKAILFLTLSDKSTMKLSATESVVQRLLESLLERYTAEAVDWLRKKGDLPLGHF